ncbi:MAG: alkaline phosphatase family protein [Candidatus Rokuibacteriota bacterium]
MGSRADVVVLGFDACDPGIVGDLAAAGKLPTFGRLLGGWARARVQNPFGLFVGALWPSFTTARSPSLTGFYCWETVSPTTYQRRPTTPREIAGARPFWRELSAAGHRVAVLDVPHTWADGPVNGIEVVEYGCHDRHFGFHTSPPSLASEILARVGPHPVLTVDPFAERQFAADDLVHRAGWHRTPEEERALLRDLLEGIARKCRLSTEILGREGWPLFISIFGESHAVGHQQWYLHDAAHPRHDPVLARELGDPVEQVYQALDRALAEHLALVGPDTTVIVLLSHGMGPHYDGTNLLEEALRRMDAADRGGPRGGPAARAVKAGWGALPTAARARLAPTTMALFRRRLRRSPPSVTGDYDLGPTERAGRRFFLQPNNSVYGGVRINLKGRESAGLVRAGAEMEAICDQIRRDLLDLVNVDTGRPAVRSVERTDRHHPRSPHDMLPDLLIEWNSDAQLETVWSAKTGIVHGPARHWRTGDHRPTGLLLAAGPTIPAGADLGEIPIGDLGPTICARLGVRLEGVDGRPVRALMRSSGSA